MTVSRAEAVDQPHCRGKIGWNEMKWSRISLWICLSSSLLISGRIEMDL